MRFTAAPSDTSPVTTRRLVWWHEVAMIVSFYVVYTFIRNQFGSAAVDPETALDNAVLMIDIEKATGLYKEAQIQSWVIDWTAFIQFWNLFYGTFHFAVTGGVLVYLYRRQPGPYRFWRTAGLATTGLALIGFALFPLMPPRLLGDCGEFGACMADSLYVDTVADIGGLWSFDSGTAQKLSNQYAAMPSLHFAWAMWSTLAVYPFLRHRWARFAMLSYPVLTVYAIIVTANHYWIDAVGGAIVLAAGIGWAHLVHHSSERVADETTTVNP